MLGRLIGLAVVAYGAYVMIQSKAHAAAAAKWDAMPPQDAATDILARTIWGEARGEGADGMQAVANVVVNRVAHPGWWGHTIQEVCQAPWQFSCWNANDPNLIKLLNVDASDPAFAVALDIAAQAVDGSLPDITGGATNYHAAGINPSWAADMTETAQIGRHIFYA